MTKSASKTKTHTYMQKEKCPYSLNDSFFSYNELTILGNITNSKKTKDGNIPKWETLWDISVVTNQYRNIQRQ